MEETDKKSSYYLYGVIPSEKARSFGPIGLSCDGTPSEVSTIGYGGIACVVSPSPVREWELSRENTVCHQKVNETVMKNFTVLPFKFCTIADSREKIIEKFLKPRRQELDEKIKSFCSKNEYGVKVFWVKMEQVYTEIMEENEKLKLWKERLARLGPGKAREQLIKIGQAVKETLDIKRKELEGNVFQELEKEAAEAKINKVFGDRMVCNEAFLVERKRQEAFDAKVSFLQESHENRLQFRYIGPTPPANFIEIVVYWDD